ncbi:MAG TPA: P-loop NTPase fold protein, partial [Solirubrobacteraceae bacterium]|nr:P-loop NTPase fold protein [Solirubrobacteraceae bacterium]
LRFDPWLFSGAEQLVTRFFSELAAQLRGSKSAAIRDLAGVFVSYGEAVAPLVPLIFGRTGAAVAAVLQRGRKTVKDKGASASAQRRELQRRLAAVQRPIVVFVDDIDRLTPEEVREVVRLVKLVGDLPGVRYLLAFDRRRVELALSDRAEDGRTYLEKIVQAPHDLPVIDPVRLRRFALQALNERLSDDQLPFFSQAAWGNLYGAGIAPMLKTLRDARRLANVAPAALKLTQGEVAAQDVLALEALRLFDPDVHGALPDLADVLTGGEAQSLPGVCLAVHANRFMMAKYIASQTHQGQRTVAEALKRAADEFGDTPKRWKNLGATVPWLGKLILFDGVTATLGAPLGVPVATSTANQTAPVLLPSIPDGNLNFRYGAQELHANAALGLKRHGPYDEDQNRSDTLRAVIVAPKAFAGSARKLEQGELQWSADSVGLALYAKAGNIPFVLHDPSGVRELVLGVGRADVFDPEQGGRRQRFGASVAIRQDGDFLFSGSTTPVNTDEDYEAHLTRLLEGSIDRYTTEQGASPERLVIYVFKRTGRRELSAMTNAIGDRDIEFALLHVNRDSPLWLVERVGNNIKPPPRGTMVALTDPDRLLITGDPRKPGGAHPLRLTLDRNSTYTDMDRLVRQAYGFTKTSYRGFQQTREPSPILFGRLLAEKVSQLVPYGFSPASAAGPLGDTPWFL